MRPKISAVRSIAAESFYLHGSELAGLLKRDRVHSVDDRVFAMAVDQVDLHRVIAVDVLVGKEKFLLQQQYLNTNSF